MPTIQSLKNCIKFFLCVGLLFSSLLGAMEIDDLRDNLLRKDKIDVSFVPQDMLVRLNDDTLKKLFACEVSLIPSLYEIQKIDAESGVEESGEATFLDLNTTQLAQFLLIAEPRFMKKHDDHFDELVTRCQNKKPIDLVELIHSADYLKNDDVQNFVAYVISQKYPQELLNAKKYEEWTEAFSLLKPTMCAVVAKQVRLAELLQFFFIDKYPVERTIKTGFSSIARVIFCNSQPLLACLSGIVNSKRQVSVWNFEEGNKVYETEISTCDQIVRVGFCPLGDHLFILDNKGYLRVENLKSGHAYTPIILDSYAMHGAIIRNEEHIIVPQGSGGVKIIDWCGKCLKNFKDLQVYGSVWNVDNEGSWLAFLSQNMFFEDPKNELCLVDLTADEKGLRKSIEISFVPQFIKFNPDGTQFLVVGEKEADLYQVPALILIKKIKFSRDTWDSIRVVYNAIGTRFFIGDKQNMFCVYNKSGKVVCSLTNNKKFLSRYKWTFSSSHDSWNEAQWLDRERISLTGKLWRINSRGTWLSPSSRRLVVNSTTGTIESEFEYPIKIKKSSNHHGIMAALPGKSPELKLYRTLESWEKQEWSLVSLGVLRLYKEKAKIVSEKKSENRMSSWPDYLKNDFERLPQAIKDTLKISFEGDKKSCLIS